MSAINKLSDTFIKKLAASPTRKKYGDGDKLWLVVTPSGSKIWRVLWKDGGTQKQFTIGTYPAISLKAARQERDRINTLLAQGIDPNDQKKWDEERQADQEAELALTFKKVAMEWYEKRTIRQSEQTRKLKLQRLEKHVFPAIGDIPFSQLKLKHLIEVLQAVEAKGHGDMAIRVHSIISNVCRYARIMGYSEYDISSGAKDALLPKPPVKHRAAITKPEEIAALLQNLQHRKGDPSTIYALKIIPYVFTRSIELRGAQWEEFDLEKKVWIIPASRMKMRTPHTVPLSRQVIELLQELRAYTGNSEYLFPSLRSKKKYITDEALLAALRRMGYTKEEMCIHGFRAMASTLLNELGYRPDVIELQLAHEERNRVRAAYNHSTLLPERTQMMQDWADYLDKLRDGQSSESPHARVVHFVSPKSLKINDFQCISNDCLIKRKKVV